MKTYIVFAKLSEGQAKEIKIKATGFAFNGQFEGTVTFEDNGKTVAIFNMAELVGFAEAEHMVNG